VESIFGLSAAIPEGLHADTFKLVTGGPGHHFVLVGNTFANTEYEAYVFYATAQIPVFINFVVNRMIVLPPVRLNTSS
jgi:hypothetical protein